MHKNNEIWRSKLVGGERASARLMNDAYKIQRIMSEHTSSDAKQTMSSNTQPNRCGKVLETGMIYPTPYISTTMTRHLM
jgi:hypothetical protein